MAAFDTESFPVASHETNHKTEEPWVVGSWGGVNGPTRDTTTFFGIVTQRIKDKYSIASFSLQDQYNLKQTGDDNLEHHQQGDIVLMYKRILITNFKRNVWESVGRVNV